MGSPEHGRVLPKVILSTALPVFAGEKTTLTWGVTVGEADPCDWIGLFKVQSDSVCLQKRLCKNEKRGGTVSRGPPNFSPFLSRTSLYCLLTALQAGMLQWYLFAPREPGAYEFRYMRTAKDTFRDSLLIRCVYAWAFFLASPRPCRQASRR